MLCNNSSQKSFFTKALSIELKNLEMKLNSGISKNEFNNLKLVYNILLNRYLEKQSTWCENSLTECVMDIIGDASSLDNPKINKFLNKNNKLNNIYEEIKDNETLDYLNMNKIAHNDINKLYYQKNSILESLKKNNIDYSFVNAKKTN